MYYWLDLDINGVTLVTHRLYHELDTMKFKTVSVTIEYGYRGKLCVIAIVSKDVMSKKELLTALETVPSNPIHDTDWRKGR